MLSFDRQNMAMLSLSDFIDMLCHTPWSALLAQTTEAIESNVRGKEHAGHRHHLTPSPSPASSKGLIYGEGPSAVKVLAANSAGTVSQMAVPYYYHIWTYNPRFYSPPIGDSDGRESFRQRRSRRFGPFNANSCPFNANSCKPNADSCKPNADSRPCSPEGDGFLNRTEFVPLIETLWKTLGTPVQTSEYRGRIPIITIYGHITLDSTPTYR